MAVRADDLAFLHFDEDRLPVAIGEGLGDVELLVTQVVELENDRIGFSAVNARVFHEVFEKVGRPFEGQRTLTGRGLCDVPALVRQVVLPFICRTTRSAEAVALVPCFPPPCELLWGLPLSTAVALGEAALFTR